MRELTTEQQEALIQWTHDPGARGLHASDDDTESRVELEIYVVASDSEQAESAAA